MIYNNIKNLKRFYLITSYEIFIIFKKIKDENNKKIIFITNLLN